MISSDQFRLEDYSRLLPDQFAGNIASVPKTKVLIEPAAAASHPEGQTETAFTNGKLCMWRLGLRPDPQSKLLTRRVA
ncbi:uncharacterized protein DFL_006459 [Arthrobotrys flagrans]|uniref:Uncharacterized protein n=1 Tax=Arthrobotrys flagrans TaxID=97331 RepID=A0A437A128_ARTFL|nr:hypothetical protein DFL_006459 [Arthrobotrys flagrans]